MKFATSLLALAGSLSTTTAYWKGFNLGANVPATGACKTSADWEADFNTIKSLPGAFTSARLYASSDCNTLANAVPAALATGVQLLVGVWATNTDHFNAEKAALLQAVQQYGFSWIVAVSVGSEDLYRAQSQHTNEITPEQLASQIYDVRGMLSTVPGYSSSIQVGHVDTWTAWVDGQNTAVIQACDFVGTDGYPYFQTTEDNNINNAYNEFWDSVNAVRNVVNNVHPGAWVWITETGWPVSGPTAGNAVPSVANAQSYWSSVACSAFNSAHTFWYTLQDYTSSPSFGVVDANRNPLYNLAC
jgi:glucan endo-1,3-beta-D-glucosidase